MERMSKKYQTFDVPQLENLHTPGAGYDILRYIGLPELFGEEKDTLLYFLGKNIARKFNINTLEDIILFFEKSGWGTLELIKSKRKERVFQLLSDSIVLRLSSEIDTEFRLEAGFLAEAVQQIEGTECECLESINKRIKQVEFAVHLTDE